MKKEKGERKELTCRPGLAQLGPVHWLMLVILLLSPGGREARGRRPQPHAGHLLLLPTPGRRLRVPRRPPGPLDRSTLPLPRLSRSLSRSRAKPSPPFVATVTTVLPSPHRLVQKPRLAALVLSAEPLPTGRPQTSSPRSSSTSSNRDRRQRPDVVRPPPSPLTRVLQPP